MLIEVAVPAPLPQTFSYSSDLDIPPGCRVLVPFGKREVVGVSLGQGQPAEIKDNTGKSKYEVKAVKSVIDQAPVYSPVLLDLARWMSRYYFCSIGDVLRTMLPAAGTKKKRRAYELTEAGLDAVQVGGGAGTYLRQVFGSKKELLLKTAEAKLERLMADDPMFPSLKQMQKDGLIHEVKESTTKARATHATATDETHLPNQSPLDWPTLTAPQQSVLDTLIQEGVEATSVPPKPFLLWGVTGAGKTEIYLKLIQNVLQKSETAQALVLVPEISLTPQMTRIFTTRFPGIVAVVHSAMTDVDRWAQLERVRNGGARILIGPRSAVFGPFRDLKLLIVDEEHDSSYKQNTGVTYNGRDIAIMRARMEGAVVLLGSATPSLESFHNAQANKYHLLRLTERATGALLPSIEVVDQKAAHTVATKVGIGGASKSIEPTEIPIAESVVESIRENRKQNLQSIVIVNRRGFAYYLLSLEQRKAVACPNCSISLTLHARSTILRCHYCEYATDIEQITSQYPGEHFAAVGYGSERAEDYLRSQLPGIVVDRLDSDVLSTGRHKLDDILARFRSGESHMLVGTQILAKGHDFPRVTLIALLEVDQLLNFPDFRAGERVFQLIVQAAGRAGRAGHPGRVLIQTQRATHPVIAAAIGQDFEQFAQFELEFRKMHHFPPFSRLISVEINGADRGQLSQFADRIDAWLEQFKRVRPEAFTGVRVSGPMVPPLETIRGRHRRTLVFSAADMARLWEIVRGFQQTFAKTPGDVRLKIEVDPQSLL